MKDIEALAAPAPRWPAQAAGRPGPLAALAGRARILAGAPIARSFSRFLGVGIVGLATDAVLFSILDLAHMAPEISRAVSLGVATLVTWHLNRRHTFAASGRRAHAEALRYAAVALAAQGFSYAVFLALVYGCPTVPRLFALLAGAGLAAFAGFAGHRFFAFAPVRGRRPDPHA